MFGITPQGIQMIETIEEYIGKNTEKYIEELIGWLKIPSISTLPQHAEDVRNAAIWAEKKLKDIGFPTIDMIEGDGHPLVYAEWLAQEHQPTLLIYGHYDVQPVDPLPEWRHPPFDPHIEKNNIYARGATDDKGQVMIVLAALEAWVQVNGTLPINVKILLEGEEEAGGAFVGEYVALHGDRFQADAALICDTHMNSMEQPTIINGLRGILYTEIAVRGAKSDLHSGSYGGVAPNPIHALCLLVSRLKGEDGRIHIDGIYDSPVAVAEEEKSFWKDDRQSLEARLLAEMGVDGLLGENDIPPHERLAIRPTLEVHGIRGGFTGEGAKTVIPAEALAKMSIRLPAGMKPDEVFTAFAEAVRKNMPSGYQVDIRHLHGGAGVSISPQNDYVRAAAAAIEKTYGRRPVYMREGGSIPIAALFDSVLGIPVVLMGFGLPDDGAHGPNEKFSLSQLYKGICTVADYLGRLRNAV
jgi:acetylornithine deacetylase/succinyl-diaminopimelate desuccinylase-like protein